LLKGRVFVYIVRINEKQKIPQCWNNSKLKYKKVEIGKIDTPSTQIQDLSLSWLGTATSINTMSGLKWFYGPKPPLLVE
jgi:hypothetical protein